MSERLDLSEIGRTGGRAPVERYGLEHLVELRRQGGETLAAERDPTTTGRSAGSAG